MPAHPIAGAGEQRPVGALDLYRGRRSSSRLPENNDDALDHIKRAWSLCGRISYELAPEAHDRCSPRSAICRICCRSRWF